MNDTFQQLLDNSLRMLLQFLNTWKNSLTTSLGGPSQRSKMKFRIDPSPNVLHYVEGFGLVMLCNCRLSPRRLAIHLLKEVKCLLACVPANKVWQLVCYLSLFAIGHNKGICLAIISTVCFPYSPFKKIRKLSEWLSKKKRKSYCKKKSNNFQSKNYIVKESNSCEEKLYF